MELELKLENNKLYLENNLILIDKIIGNVIQNDDNYLKIEVIHIIKYKKRKIKKYKLKSNIIKIKKDLDLLFLDVENGDNIEINFNIVKIENVIGEFNEISKEIVLKYKII